ncbi:hypothetical protein O181_012649 [Austropuccinia psidii MF-1]|uniref:Reverse transcriptase domain-containing protein n=1 Tax=Austropuccinia psidii MF-1 TaxID=1389203 RepID=A0A9Q3BV01_9BASI|nr:hypothetical protein [Austropuccinia psidii MF-1]
MLRYQSEESKKTYYGYQNCFKQKVWELKSNHWSKFLAEKGPYHENQAYRYMKTKQEDEITPLGDQEALPLDFPPITSDEIETPIQELSNKKAPGPDSIPNELIKLAKSLLTPHLLCLYNSCFERGEYPSNWKEASMAIIRKMAKDNYTDPNSYRPIALLNTLSKLFEKIINNRLAYWAHQANAIHPGHIGGRLGRSINDGFVTLSSWREGKAVVGIFLDVKSAYPSVHRIRLIHTLKRKGCPPYLYSIINSFLSSRTTSLKLNDFISQKFLIPNSLPQGSPLLVTLYLLYNSDLLLPGPPLLNEDNISLAYIDNITHLLVVKDFQQGQDIATEAMIRSQNWGLRYGAIFDVKKTNSVFFTRKKQPSNKITIAGSTHPLDTEVKWLGVVITSTLSLGSHLRMIKTKINNTINKLSRIIQQTFGLPQKEARTLVSAIMLTRALHGSIFWYTQRNKKTVERQFNSWPFRAGLDQTTRQTYSQLSPFQIYSPDRQCVPTSGMEGADCRPPSHLLPLNNLLEKDTLLQQHSTRAETLSPFPILPWSARVVDLINMGLTKEQAKEKIAEQLLQEEAAHTLILFVDGSLIPGKEGGAAAMDLLANHISTHGTPPTMVIFSDSQAAHRCVTLPKRKSPGQQLILKIFHNFLNWSLSFWTRLYWCPGHLGI